MPGDDSGLVGFGTTGTDFRFIADVTSAKCYELDYGDDNADRGIQPDANGRAVRRYRYTGPGRYWAVMKAWRLRQGDADRGVDCERELNDLAEPIELRLRIVVRRLDVTAPAPDTVAIFSAAPSDPDDPTADGNPVTWADFTFRAYVSGATSYAVNFDDRDVDTVRRPAPAGRAALWRHRYEKPGVYTATMTAQRNSGEPIELRQKITVTAPAAAPAAVPRQWPPVRSMAAPVVGPEETNLLPWLLLATVLIATALSRVLFLGKSDSVTFGATKSQGQYTVKASTDATDAVSMHVRNEDPQYTISGNARQLRLRSGPIDDES